MIDPEPQLDVEADDFSGKYPIVISGLTNRFGDVAVHELSDCVGQRGRAAVVDDGGSLEEIDLVLGVCSGR